MQPTVQYVASADGTTIAYSVVGEGPPLLFVRSSPGQLDLDLTIPTSRRTLEWLAQRFTVVRLDVRGTGLSQRGAVDHSLERWVEDWQAVVDRVGLERFAILGGGPTSLLALVLAHRWGSRATRLVLMTALASGADLLALPGVSVLSLMQTEYEIATEALASTIYGWSSDEARIAAHVHRASRTRDEAIAASAVMLQSDMTPLLPEIRVPTLVWQPREGFLSSMEISRRIVAKLPNARLLVRSGNVVCIDFDTDATVQEVERFLTWESPAASGSPRGTAVILFADVVDSTGLTERLGDAAFRTRMRKLDAALRSAIRAHGGTPVDGKPLGDGVLATFPSAHEAVAAGLDCAQTGAAANLPLHVGVHAGDVICEGSDVHGGAVNVAARVCAASAPGEVLVSDLVRALARTSAQVAVEDRGEQTLRGVGEALRLFAVRPRA
jgi:class 3 adenylate cyclase